MDLKLDDTGDLELGDDGDLVLVTGTDAIGQHLRMRLRLLQGEWFLDTREGVPWASMALGVKSPSLARIRKTLMDAVRTTPGVTSCDQMTVTLDAATRVLSVAFHATVDDGSVLDYSEAFSI